MQALTYLTHGFDHRPGDPKNDPAREGGVFPLWRSRLPDYALREFPWDSGLLFRDVFKAWWNRHLSTYSWAYNDLAVAAAKRLVADAERQQEPLDIIAHSLGSRVVLLALNVRPRLFRRVVFFNAAETVSQAAPIIAKNKGVRFLNLCVRSDDVLDKCAGWFSPRWIGKERILGQDGLPGLFKDPDLSRRVYQIFLDDPDTQELYRIKEGWDIQGDNPKSIGDHWFSYIHEDNWHLPRRFLKYGHV